MKIFISHSSKDKWAARRIAADLRSKGAAVFLDEKDIETGASIDVEIRKHLKSSDHFLIVLSPASIGSQWVLLELGGALALEKKIIPILLYVGVNEVPQAINLKLARDINDIEKYYEEVERGIKGQAIAVERTSAPTGHPFSVGDTVRIISNEPKRVIRRTGPMTKWVESMDRYLGKEGKILRIDPDGDCELDVDDKLFWWAPVWLERKEA